MKKKIFLIIILIILIITIIVLGIFKANPKKEKNSNTNTNRNFIMNSQSTSKINTHGENSGIYVGVTENEKDNYVFLSIKIDKSASTEEQAKALISEISTAIGYKIDINSIEINNKKIKVDFAKTSAPFELQESYLDLDNIKYFTTSDYVVPKTIFDSTNKTLKAYFGNDYEVYFSSDNENIDIENEKLPIHINSNQAY